MNKMMAETLKLYIKAEITKNYWNTNWKHIDY